MLTRQRVLQTSLHVASTQRIILMRNFFYLVLLLLFSANYSLAEKNKKQTFKKIPLEKGIFGWIEKVKIHPGKILLHAKLDSGADHSSLSAMNIKEFKKKGKNWVCLLYTSPSPRDRQKSRMPSSA